MAAAIMCLKLITGEELIGSIDVNSSSFFITNPAAIVMMPGSTGKVNMGLVPFLPYSEDTRFEILKDHAIIVHNPSTELINNYNRLFGSGIQIAGAM